MPSGLAADDVEDAAEDVGFAEELDVRGWKAEMRRKSAVLLGIDAGVEDEGGAETEDEAVDATEDRALDAVGCGEEGAGAVVDETASGADEGATMAEV